MTPFTISRNSAVLLMAALMLSFQGHAAVAPRAESLKLVAFYDIGTQRYREIAVSCSNRTEVPVYKREQKREWCVGGPSTGDCYRDNISAAMRACAGSTSSDLAER